MARLRIRAALPEQYSVYLLNQGKRQYLSNDDTVELDLCRENPVTLLQDGPLTKMQKVLVAIGIFLTAPLQLAYLYYSDMQWDQVIPFRVNGKFYASGETMCHITITEGENQFQPPKIDIAGPNVFGVEYHCEASPWVFRDACGIYLCRVISAGIWLLGLMAYLLAVSVAKKTYFGLFVTGAVCLATVFTVAYLVIRACRLCRQRIKHLEQINW